jgi:prepilin-type processing-associated H-X9-DG protein
LIELLVVIAIIAIVAAILFPVFQSAKVDTKRIVCLSNQKQLALAKIIYVDDFDGRFPQTKDSVSNPAVTDSDGSLNEPDYGSFFTLLQPYASKSQAILVCPLGTDPFGQKCIQANPDVPDLNSYIVNGFFVFGLNESSVSSPASLILFSERRDEAGDADTPYCDYVYYPWFNPSNPAAPENDMDAETGAVDTHRHDERPNFAFADGHAQNFVWNQTYNPPKTDLHWLP